MRSLYFTAAESGMTRAQLRHGEAKGSWIRLGRGNYRFGSDPVSQLDRCLGPLAATNATACRRLAGVLHGFDGIALSGPEMTLPVGSSNTRPGVRRRQLLLEPGEIAGFHCTSPLETLIDLAAVVDDLLWEQALESALRNKLLTLDELSSCSRI